MRLALMVALPLTLIAVGVILYSALPKKVDLGQISEEEFKHITRRLGRMGFEE